MTIQEAIKKAIEGGWSEQQKALYRLMVVTGDLNLALDCVFTDPSFWRSLGKALEWGSHWITVTYSAGLTDDVLCRTFIGHARYWQHRFIDHLADGGTPETYFETLT